MPSQLCEIRELGAAETYAIRHAVLRQGHPPETARFDGDTDPGVFHLGAFSGGEHAGVATFLPRLSPLFDAAEQYQLRGMAVLPRFQGLGLGRELLEAAYPRICAAGCGFLWCNARVSALEFYRRQGFTAVGAQFDTPLAGPHYAMYRNLHN